MAGPTGNTVIPDSQDLTSSQFTYVRFLSGDGCFYLTGNSSSLGNPWSPDTYVGLSNYPCIYQNLDLKLGHMEVMAGANSGFHSAAKEYCMKLAEIAISPIFEIESDRRIYDLVEAASLFEGLRILILNEESALPDAVTFTTSVLSALGYCEDTVSAISSLISSKVNALLSYTTQIQH